ncbi:hypothetical protein FI667_g3383, partial [Globisporangium splendens]
MRLVCNRVVVHKIKEKRRWTEFQAVLLFEFEALGKNAVELMRDLRTRESQVQVLGLLKFESKQTSGEGGHSESELGILNAVFVQIARISRTEVPRSPDWFGAFHEIKLRNTSLKWQRGAYADRHAFADHVSDWYAMNFLHVVQLFGACHVGDSFTVCEHAGNGILGEYLTKSDSKAQMWQKLYEAAPGLQFIHSRKIVHSDIRCKNILIGSDKKAEIKISSSLMSEESSEPISFESDILSFGRWADLVSTMPEEVVQDHQPHLGALQVLHRLPRALGVFGVAFVQYPLDAVLEDAVNVHRPASHRPDLADFDLWDTDFNVVSWFAPHRSGSSGNDGRATGLTGHRLASITTSRSSEPGGPSAAASVVTSTFTHIVVDWMWQPFFAKWLESNIIRIAERSTMRQASEPSLRICCLEVVPTHVAQLDGKILPNAHAIGDVDCDDATELIFGSITGTIAMFKVEADRLVKWRWCSVDGSVTAICVDVSANDARIFVATAEGSCFVFQFTESGDEFRPSSEFLGGYKQLEKFEIKREIESFQLLNAAAKTGTTTNGQLLIRCTSGEWFHVTTLSEQQKKRTVQVWKRPVQEDDVAFIVDGIQNQGGESQIALASIAGKISVLNAAHERQWTLKVPDIYENSEKSERFLVGISTSGVIFVFRDLERTLAYAMTRSPLSELFLQMDTDEKRHEIIACLAQKQTKDGSSLLTAELLVDKPNPTIEDIVRLAVASTPASLGLS